MPSRNEAPRMSGLAQFPPRADGPLSAQFLPLLGVFATGRFWIGSHRKRPSDNRSPIREIWPAETQRTSRTSTFLRILRWLRQIPLDANSI